MNLRHLASLILITALMASPPSVSPRAGGQEESNVERYATKRVQPPYPPNAEKYRIEGVVTVQVSVGGDGKVMKAEFIRGHNIFRSVSLDAAKKWEFRPPGSNSMEGTIRFAFKLK